MLGFNNGNQNKYSNYHSHGDNANTYICIVVPIKVPL